MEEKDKPEGAFQARSPEEDSFEWVITEDRDSTFDADLKEHGLDGVHYDAYVKWDGCVDFTRYFNMPKGMEGRNPDDRDNLHICSLARTVAMLADLLRVAQGKLGGEWEGEATLLKKLLHERGWDGPYD